DHLQSEPDPELYWEFLRILTALSFDLGTATSNTEALVQTLLAHTARASSDPIATAEASWSTLLEVASNGRQAAASYDRDSLPRHLLDVHDVVPSAQERAKLELMSHGQMVRSSIRSTFAGGFTLDRHPQASALLELLDSTRVVVVSGAA